MVAEVFVATNVVPARVQLPYPEARRLAAFATAALLAEARLTPKPGLVDGRGSGAHDDLSLALLELSAHTLQPFFQDLAMAAQRRLAGLALREELGAIGREAEAAMLAATGGVNTHRGAIWALGLLVAAAASEALSLDALCKRAGALARLPDRFAGSRRTHGAEACERYRVDGARGEACAGFPHIRTTGLPMLHSRRNAGHGETTARIDALLAIMRTLPDTCLLHRGGPEALAVAQHGAARVLKLGGYAAAEGRLALAQLEDALLARRASPGGSADLLAATLFCDSLYSEALHD